MAGGKRRWSGYEIAFSVSCRLFAFDFGFLPSTLPFPFLLALSAQISDTLYKILSSFFLSILSFAITGAHRPTFLYDFLGKNKKKHAGEHINPPPLGPVDTHHPHLHLGLPALLRRSAPQVSLGARTHTLIRSISWALAE